MHWAIGRQILYALAAILIIAFIGAGGYFGFFYHVPTCSDGKMNGSEEGVDCGGACQKLCTGPVISVVWARPVFVTEGVYHAAAMVRNPDTAAAGTVPYTVSLFDRDGILIVRREGVLALNPGEIAPLFEPNLETGTRIPARAFVDIGAGTWVKAERAMLPVKVVPATSAEEVNTSRVLKATVENTSASPVGVIVTAFLYDASSTVIAASQTVVDPLGAREKRTLTFTWPSDFSVPVATFDLTPRLK